MGIAAHSSFTAQGIAEKRGLHMWYLATTDPVLNYRMAYERKIGATARPDHQREMLTMRRLLDRLAPRYGVTPAEVISQTRKARVVFARMAFCYWARRRTSKSYPQIGRFLGNRDHSTIIHSVSTYPAKRAAMGRHLRPLDTGKRGN